MFMQKIIKGELMTDRKQFFLYHLNLVHTSFNSSNFPTLDSRSVKPIQQILIQEKNLILKAI